MINNSSTSNMSQLNQIKAQCSNIDSQSKYLCLLNYLESIFTIEKEQKQQLKKLILQGQIQDADTIFKNLLIQYFQSVIKAQIQNQVELNQINQTQFDENIHIQMSPDDESMDIIKFLTNIMQMIQEIVAVAQTPQKFNQFIENSFQIDSPSETQIKREPLIEIREVSEQNDKSTIHEINPEDSKKVNGELPNIYLQVRKQLSTPPRRHDTQQYFDQQKCQKKIKIIARQLSQNFNTMGISEPNSYNAAEKIDKQIFKVLHKDIFTKWTQFEQTKLDTIEDLQNLKTIDTSPEEFERITPEFPNKSNIQVIIKSHPKCTSIVRKMKKKKSSKRKCLPYITEAVQQY